MTLAKARFPLWGLAVLLVLVMATAMANAMTVFQPDEVPVALSYQVDVFVNGNHHAKHQSAAAALRCLNNRGNVAAFSEFGTWRLHLLCWEDDTLYDVIITRINKWVDKWSNPNADLITAYAPKGKHLFYTTADGQTKAYLQHLVESVGGKVVRLKFNPGEIIFVPK